MTTTPQVQSSGNIIDIVHQGCVLIYSNVQSPSLWSFYIKIEYHSLSRSYSTIFLACQFLNSKIYQHLHSLFIKIQMFNPNFKKYRLYSSAGSVSTLLAAAPKTGAKKQLSVCSLETWSVWISRITHLCKYSSWITQGVSQLGCAGRPANVYHYVFTLPRFLEVTKLNRCVCLQCFGHRLLLDMGVKITGGIN